MTRIFNITIKYGLFLTPLILLLNLAAAMPVSGFQLSGVRFDRQAMTELELPLSGDVPSLLADFDYYETRKVKGKKIDLNGDGTEDIIVEADSSICGTGGCPYAILEGLTYKRIATLFGNPVILSDERINGYPVISSYAHMNAESGNYSVLVFDGNKYKEVSRLLLKGDSLVELFKEINKLTRMK